ncbi:SH3 domain-containing protein [Bradyrhizobium sp. 180]|uniref:SH3 domain-containing protein n=1 Tax=unclassified Bradyrhizobium TaxID=2631580 RepID=UPI001FFB1250|nr:MULTISPECIES: SH3 domain-containing protein [unclassified Bradyrhizobium]MCK1420855.1 SH3 domain-containing protein [Bradyrhizobium sp. CW12]MCK1491525.1 SH3 domain-containing protein [Bradyrhizobium sp. 180]MCK1527298.1 SH3 domain-containing protein [Bradyrhizobium sp. 182]MCK1596101.1 SH3 domain-containing protein [Bradyrhizobium sp. 164]MCK1648882.1 SH3 domain-containing protein [Bradyrhizobium sp. 154]
MRLKSVLLAALLLAPTAALAAPGIVTVSTGLRAGPGTGFPLVDRIPGGARVNIHGCLRGNAWCDVSFSDDRGWVSSQYLEYLYRNHYVYLPDYVEEIDVPVVPFVLTSYWSNYYAGRPWYRRQAYWNNYWTSHQRFATRMTLDPRAARIGRAATRDAAIALERSGVHARGNVAVTGRDAAVGRPNAIAKRDAAVTIDRTRAARSERIANERTVVQSRSPRDAQARMMHDHAASRAAVRAQPMARAHEVPRVSAAPAARPAMPHVAQPNVSHGSPMNARAQMPAPRAAAPAMPHPGGGAPHINAPRGGPPAGGPGGGHQKH